MVGVSPHRTQPDLYFLKTTTENDPAMTTATKKTSKPKTQTTKPTPPVVAKAAKKVAATRAKAVKPAARKTTAVQKAAAVEKATKKATAQGRQGARAVLHQTRDASFRLLDSQRAIWLAGLGALSKANASTGNKGEQAFEALIKAGESLEAQANLAIDTQIERMKSGIDGATDALDQGIDRFGTTLDTLVEQALDRVGFPKVNTLNELMERLTDLSKTLETKIRTAFTP